MMRKKRVLLVEDDKEIRSLMKQFLREMEIEHIYEAADGFEALKIIDEASEDLDLVICDWNMPGMTGYSLYRQLMTTHPDMPFIMATSRNDMESIKLVKDLGLQSYLVKPLSIGQLEQKVYTALKEKKPAGSSAFKRNIVPDQLTT